MQAPIRRRPIPSAQPAQQMRPSKLADSSKPVLVAQGPATPAILAAATAQVEASGKKPNILFIMGDDVGWFNIGAYHRGIMSGKTPHLDKLA